MYRIRRTCGAMFIACSTALKYLRSPLSTVIDRMFPGERVNDDATMPSRQRHMRQEA